LSGTEDVNGCGYAATHPTLCRTCLAVYQDGCRAGHELDATNSQVPVAVP
jgi:hypothetical protein